MTLLQERSYLFERGAIPIYSIEVDLTHIHLAFGAPQSTGPMTNQETTSKCSGQDHRNQDGKITPLPVVWVSNRR